MIFMWMRKHETSSMVKKKIEEENNPENPELSPLAEENFYEEDDEYAGHDMDDLQISMKQAIKNLSLKFPSPEETEETAPSVHEAA